MKDTIRKLLAYLMVFIMLFNSCPTGALAEAVGSGMTRIELPEEVVDAGEGFSFGDIAPIALGDPKDWTTTSDLHKPTITITVGEGANAKVYYPGDKVIYHEGDYIAVDFKWREGADKEWGTFSNDMEELTFQLPDCFDFTKLKGEIRPNDSFYLGQYWVDNNNVLHIKFDGKVDSFNKLNDRYIGIEFEGKLRAGESSWDKEEDVHIGESSFTFETTFKDTNIKVDKSMTELRLGDDGKYYSDVTMHMYVTGNDAKDVVLHDVMTGKFQFKEGSLKVSSNKRGENIKYDYTPVNDGNGSFDLKFAELKKDETITITYTVEIDVSEIGKYTTDVDANTIRAEYKDRNDKPKESNQATARTKTGKGPSFDKTLDSFDKANNTITWTLKFNSGRFGDLKKHAADPKLKQHLLDSGFFDVVFKDILDKDVLPDEESSAWFEEKDGVYEWNIGKILDFITTNPRVQSKRESDGSWTYTFTYTTKVNPPTEADPKKVYRNTLLEDDKEKKWGDDKSRETENNYDDGKGGNGGNTGNGDNGPTEPEHKFQGSQDDLDVDKKFVDMDPDGKRMNWTITSKIPKDEFNTFTLTDTPTDGRNERQHNVVWAKVTIVADDGTTVVIEEGNIPVEWVKSFSYSSTVTATLVIDGTKLPKNFYGASITVEVKTAAMNWDWTHHPEEVLEPPYDYINDATVNVDGISKSAKDHNKKNKDETPAGRGGVEKRGEYENGRFKWQIIIGTPMLYVDENGQMSGFITDKSTFVTIKDTLPTNHVLDGSIKIYAWSESLGFREDKSSLLQGGGDNATITNLKEQDGVLSFQWGPYDTNHFKDWARGNYDSYLNELKEWAQNTAKGDTLYLAFEYHTRLTELGDLWQDAVDNKVTFRNHVDTNGFGSDEAEAKYPLADPVDKVGKQGDNIGSMTPSYNADKEFDFKSDNNIRYVIDVNPDKLSLNGKLTVVDTMQSGLQVITESVYVMDAETKAYVDFDIDYTNNGFTLTTVDGHHLWIVYWAKVIDTPVGGSFTKTNKVSVYLDGKLLEQDGTNTSGAIKNTGNVSGGVLNEGNFLLYKYGRKTVAGRPVGGMVGLEGAEFEIWTVNPTTLELEKRVLIDGGTSVITLENGSVNINIPEEYDITKYVFALVEVNAPDGYDQLLEPVYFVFNSYENKNKLPKNVNIVSLDPGDIFSVENSPEDVEYGDLTVQKFVVADEINADEEFTFTVTLYKDAALTEQATEYDFDPFKNGVTTFTLKHNQSVKLIGLPAGWYYKVEETDGGEYTVSWSGQTGKIEKNRHPVASATNKKPGEGPQFGDLTISKIVKGDGADPNREFKFTITLNPSIDGTYSGVVFKNGEATITLKGGESKTIEGLPAGVTYTVTETKVDGYTADKDELTGTIPEDGTVKAEFVNTYSKPEVEVQPVPWKPSVTKKITKTDLNAPLTGEYTFNFKLTGPSGYEQTGSVTVNELGVPKAVDFENAYTFTATGEYEFTLTETGDQPTDWTYDKSVWNITVKVDADSEGNLYVSRVKYQNGDDTRTWEKTEATPNDTITLEYVNTYTKTTNNEVTFNPGVKKSVKGGVAPDETFTFTLSLYSVNGKPMSTSDSVKLPDPSTTMVAYMDDGQNTNVFENVTITDVGTYIFKIEEDDQAQDGWTKDAGYWLVTVEVTRDATTGDLKIGTPSYAYYGANDELDATRTNGATAAEFVNEHKKKPTEWQPKVKKSAVATEEGTDVPTGETFSFELMLVNSETGAKIDDPSAMGVEMPKKTEIDVEYKGSNVDNTGVFDKVTFSKNGTYTFKIVESGLKDAQMAKGWAQDTGYWLVTVKVELNNAKTEYSIVGTPSYAYYDVNDKPDATRTNGATEAEFVNRHTKTPTTWQPGVKKTAIATVDGTEAPTGETFSFELTLVNSETGMEIDDPSVMGVRMPDKTEIDVTYDGNTANNTEMFENVTFSKTGTYTFKIEESDLKGTQTANGWERDTGYWLVTVEIVVDPTDATKLVVANKEGNPSYKYYADGKLDATKTSGATVAVFENKHTRKPTTWQPKVKKTANAIVSGTTAPVNEEFSFELTLVDNETYAEIENPSTMGVVMPATTKIDITYGGPNADNTKQFGDVTFSKVGTYTFKIKEADLKPEQMNIGWKKDDGHWLATVEVGADPNDVSKLAVLKMNYKYISTANGRPDSTEEAEFINNYTKPASKTVELPIVKTVIGPDASDTELFEFVLTKGEVFDPKDGASLTDNKEFVSVWANAKDGGKFTITFNEPGTYSFKVTENLQGTQKNRHWTSDSVVWTVTYTVSAVKGELAVNGPVYEKNGEKDENAKAVEFKNTYTPEPDSVTLTVSKAISGIASTDEVFSFTLLDEKGNEIETVTVTGMGSESFSPIEYTQTGDYTYTIVENRGSNVNWTYDNTVWNVKVEVEDIYGTLKANVTYEANGDKNSAAAQFTNAYSPLPTSYVPIVNKTVTSVGTPDSRTFNFTLAITSNPENGASLSNPNASVTGTGRTNFGAITFEKAGTYTFSISEVNESGDGWTYDSTVWTLTVVVEDNNGNLRVASATYAAGDATNPDAANFTNTYIPQPQLINVSGRKIWVDNSNAAGYRPDTIEVVLLANGVRTAYVPTWTNTNSDVWTYTFSNLPDRDENGNRIEYTVQETPTDLYTATYAGYDITNTIQPRQDVTNISISGTKRWEDNNNANGNRPASVTIELLRDGVVIDTATVSATSNWQYAFTNLPDGDGYATYSYTIRERAVGGYYAIYDGYDVTNVELPEEIITPFTNRARIFGQFTEEQLEDLIELLDYNTPLFGILGTGDELPVYPFVFGGVGILAIAMLVLFGRKKKKA